MLIRVLKSKLHNAAVTSSQVYYEGSIGIDADLMEAVGIVPYEAVLIADVTNGARLTTYAIPAEAGSKEISILGAAANLIKPKDRIIIFSFMYCSVDEAKQIKPKVLVLDEKNEILQDRT